MAEYENREEEISKLKVRADNVRRHPIKQINELKRNLERWGQYRPIIIDEKSEILAGNGLYLALKEMGVEKAWVRVYDNLKESEKIKLMISDNKIFDLGTPHQENIDKILEWLSSNNDFDIPGFDEELLKELYSEPVDNYGVFNEEELEKVQKNPTTPKREIEIKNKNVQVDENGKVFIKCSCGKTLWL